MKPSKYIHILACPSCQHQELILSENNITCPKCTTVYKIVNNIPILLPKHLLDSQENDQLVTFNKHYKKVKSKGLDQLWRQSMLNRIFNQKFIKNTNTYLDIGCGSKPYTVISAAKKHHVKLSVGIDISQTAVEIANKTAKHKNLSSKTIFIVASAQHLPFKKNLFDYVTAISVLEHLRDQNSCLNSINKILKQKKFFFFVVPNSYKLIPFYLRSAKRYFDNKIGHLRTYSKIEINQLAQKYNFKIKNIYYNGHPAKILQILVSKLNLINKKLWWYIETKDINNNIHGLQINILFQKR